ncbi:hypothetical protein B9Z55_013181 [Caenorhabditis nigoni]|uniref:Uncharacterized protein n=1 Tax=Caenorhabditis nigoni TaxID=1611254 RepID=A0A2G5U0Q8_9PELO|nr:hypothetical protein B9Z55_013181 [Caenorhabditis nigoni]
MHTQNLIASVLLLLPSISLASEAAVHVRGRLMCDGKPYVDGEISLYEKNWVGRDTKLVVTKTDADGKFVLKSSMSEWPGFTPTPYIYFGNYCDINNDLGSFQCADGIKIFVPEYFVHEGNLPKSIFDIGEVEMVMGLNTDKMGLEKLVYTIFTQQDCRDV